MAVTIRPCIVCHSPMECSRSNKYACSNHCHSRMHKRRIKLGLTTKEIIDLYREEIETTDNQKSTEE